MGRKIFISYKYSDARVQQLNANYNTKARHYVDRLQELLDDGDHINKGEQDGQSLADFSDEHIGSKLRDKIYDSSVTIVLISKGTKNPFENERNQWMPWEISYSLKEHSRDDRTSKTNAILAVALPDEYGSYEYYITQNTICNSRTLHTDFLFDIMSKNMFNTKVPATRDCNGNKIYTGHASYIETVKWSDFISNINYYIGVAVRINGNINNYNIVKSV